MKKEKEKDEVLK